MRFKKKCVNNFQRLHFFFHPYFCPFLLLEYNKEAGKNIVYTQTLAEITKNLYSYRMENEPQTPKSDLMQMEQVKRLIHGLDLAERGYYRISLSTTISSSELLQAIKSVIPNCEIVTCQAPGTADELFKWIAKITKKKEGSPKSEKTIFVLDLSGLSSGMDIFFSMLNANRNSVVGNTNGPMIVITPLLSDKEEQSIARYSDLSSTCSGSYTIRGKE